MLHCMMAISTMIYKTTKTERRNIRSLGIRRRRSVHSRNLVTRTLRRSLPGVTSGLHVISVASEERALTLLHFIHSQQHLLTRPSCLSDRALRLCLYLSVQVLVTPSDSYDISFEGSYTQAFAISFQQCSGSKYLHMSVVYDGETIMEDTVSSNECSRVSRAAYI